MVSHEQKRSTYISFAFWTMMMVNRLVCVFQYCRCACLAVVVEMPLRDLPPMQIIFLTGNEQTDKCNRFSKFIRTYHVSKDGLEARPGLTTTQRIF